MGNPKFDTSKMKVTEVADVVNNFKGDRPNEENCKKFNDLCSLLANVVRSYNLCYGEFGEAVLKTLPPSPNRMNSMAYIDFPNDSPAFLQGENKSLGLAISMADDFFIAGNKKNMTRLSFGILNTYEKEGVNA